MEGRLVDNALLNFEKHLSALGQVKPVVITSVDDPQFHPCDLLIIMAHAIPRDHFETWLEKLKSRMAARGKIWTPALIVASIPFSTLKEILLSVMHTNWYFDVLSPEHIESLPMRVANLLRIHDHLHELHRYSSALESLEKKTDILEQQLEQLKQSC